MMNKKLRITLQQCAMVAATAFPTGLGMAQPAAQLVARVAGSDVRISFDLHPQRTDDLARRLATSAPVSVVWTVNARQRGRFWPDRAVQRAVVGVTARRAGTSDLFTITRTVNGQQGPAVQATLADSYRYLTAFESPPFVQHSQAFCAGRVSP